MRTLLQRVSWAKVEINGKIVGQIQKGLLVLLGVAHGDTDAHCQFIIEKLTNLRIFEDDTGKMNLSLLDIKGELLVVSQFTLYADCKKGRRPSFTDAAAPNVARDMYKKFVQKCSVTGLKVEQGEFGANMAVSLCNSGPVTIMLDTRPESVAADGG